MRKSVLTAIILLTPACAEPDTCVESHTDLAFEDPGPWGPSPAELFSRIEAPRSGTLTWRGGGELGELSPPDGQTPLEVSAALDRGSATAVDLEHVGDGRLACIDSVEIHATVTITTADGALAEQLEVELVSEHGSFGGFVIGEVDLGAHGFAGSLEWRPGEPGEQLFLRLSWADDAAQTVRGWLVWGDAASTSVAGDQITLAGTGRVLAELEAVVSP